MHDIPANKYDVAIIGGGLAGLSLSIQLAKAGYKIILFEKENYPFHRVCGEYISMESWNFINNLGLNLQELNLPKITNLIVSSPSGNMISHPLDPGGFGISRYKLDYELYKIALDAGVEVCENSKVEDVHFSNEFFTLPGKIKPVIAKVVVAAFGKRSNLDVKWSRKFILKKHTKLNNYIGVKYHVQTEHPESTIALHNFKNGYCGISKIEDNKYCLCYLTTADNLKEHHSIPRMEEMILQKNPHLKNIFQNATLLYASPVTISQVSFENKSPVEDHIIMIGDSAGMITPLCGNGMSMAFHSGKIAFIQIDSFLKNNLTRSEFEEQYRLEWKKQFAGRLRTGRIIQSLFGKESVTNLFIRLLKPFPSIIGRLIRATHGKSF